MKLLSLNSCHVPADLNSVTRYDPSSEVNPESVGMKVKQRDAIWRATELLDKTGNSALGTTVSSSL